MAENEFEKTEAPTPRRLQEARQQGNVARSTDLTAACALLASVVLLYVFGLRLLGGMRANLETMLTAGMGPNPTRADDVTGLFAYAAHLTVTSLAPLLLGIMAVAVVATVSQVGFILTAKPLDLSLTKLSPLRGLRNMFNMRGATRLIMSFGKLLVVVGVSVWVVIDDLPLIVMIAELDAAPMFIAACRLVYALALKLVALLLVLALLDYALQRWQYLKELRMSKVEVKEELKRMEGDPMIKQRRARVARQLALQRIGQAVPKADVVVTNPTHYAIALQYDSAAMNAPKVTAKGADFLAMRIRQIAMANGVPMVERRELARAIYRTVEVGQEVPPQFYQAVAEILAYVYRLSGRKTA